MGSMGGLGWLASTGRSDMAAPHSIIPSGYDRRSPQLISEVNAAVKQCHAVPITITIWPIPFRGAALDDIHRFRFRHPTRLVGLCHKQVLQPRTVSASECASLAESKAHTKSGESTAGRNLCSKFSIGGDDLDQSIVALWESMTWKDFDILTQRRSSRSLKTMMPHVIRNEKSILLRSGEHTCHGFQNVCLMRWIMI